MKRRSTEERRRQIADVALKIIAEEGLRRFTVANISERVGLAEGTIFRHFEDMDDIVMEAVERLESLLAEGIDEPIDAEDPLDRVGQFLQRRVELLADRPEVLKALFSEDLAKAGPEEAAERLQGLKRRSMQFVLHQFREASQQGLVDADIPAEHLFFLAHGAALATVYSADDVREVTGEALEVSAIWASIRRLIRAHAK